MLFYKTVIQDREDKEAIRRIQEAHQRGEISEQEQSERIDTVMDNARIRFMQAMEIQRSIIYESLKK